ncbi:hypothetical protein BDR04DRAFT_1090046 [Suillus decipiens]|nr:hypothetical protein BDR04DRAFT_1090046 [Suillus decipiens]
MFETVYMLCNSRYSVTHSNFYTPFFYILFYPVRCNATSLCLRFHIIIRPIRHRGPLPFRSISSSCIVPIQGRRANSILDSPLKITSESP